MNNCWKLKQLFFISSESMQISSGLGQRGQKDALGRQWTKNILLQKDIVYLSV